MTVNLYCTDVLDGLQHLRDDSIQLTVTSPPYGLGKPYEQGNDAMDYTDYLRWSVWWMDALWSVTERGGRACINLPLDVNVTVKNGEVVKEKTPFAADFTHHILKHTLWSYNTTILWLERNVSKRTAWGSFKSASAPYVNTAAEIVLVLHKGERKRATKGESDVTGEEFIDWTLGLWDFPGESAKRVGHPAPFPEELPYRLIKLFSYVGDTVLDPFCGVSTTMKVAERLGRNSIGFDREQEYIDLSRKRLGLEVPVA